MGIERGYSCWEEGNKPMGRIVQSDPREKRNKLKDQGKYAVKIYVLCPPVHVVVI
jgi:hypothetical protein